MAENSKIEWTDASWNPVVAIDNDTGKVGWHCEKVSPGCANCYAERMNMRNLPNRGTGLPYTRSSRDKVTIEIHEKTLIQPLKWRKPRKVFVGSQTDLFAPFVPFELIDQVFAVMVTGDRNTYQVLTKRPDRMSEYFETRRPDRDIDTLPPQWLHWCNDVQDETGRNLTTRYGRKDRFGRRFWPLDNIWLGCSVENQEQAEARIHHLLRCPAAVRFLSCEPLLGPVDLTRIKVGEWDCDALAGQWWREMWSGSPDEPPECQHESGPGIDWVIVGGESGPDARPMHPDWARSIRDQCQASGVPFFFKQWGEFLPAAVFDDEGFAGGRAFDDPQGGRSSATMRIPSRKAFQTGKTVLMKAGDARGDGIMLDDDTFASRVGKKAAGRTLDGREWSEFPEPAAAGAER